jgi:hypothetical protein
MNNNTIIAMTMSILMLVLSACVTEQISNEILNENPNETPKDTKGLRTIINTRMGDLTLSYVEGKAILQGTLDRSTPCVNWQVDTLIAESYPEQVRFSVVDKSTAEMCIQVLGEPQEVYAEAQVSEQARITVLFREETVFEGQLE